MLRSTVRKSLAAAVVNGGKYSLIFAGAFFLFLVTTLLLVGDGTAPKVTYLSANIVSYSLKFLGIPKDGSLYSVVILWTFPVFAIFSVPTFLLWMSAPSTGQDEIDPEHEIAALVTLGLLLLAGFYLYSDRQNSITMQNEEQQVIEFVKHNTAHIDGVGGEAQFLISGSTRVNQMPVKYQVMIRGNKATLYAVVNVNRVSKYPSFALICVSTNSSWGDESKCRE